MATRTKNLLSNKIAQKLKEAVYFGYKYNNGKYLEDFSTEQCMILALLKSFITRDLYLYYMLQDIVPKTIKMEYFCLSLWLRDYFKFNFFDVLTALTFAYHLARKGQLNLPPYILLIFFNLYDKYNKKSLFNNTLAPYVAKKEEWRMVKRGILNQVSTQSHLLAKPICDKIIEAVRYGYKYKRKKYSLLFIRQEQAMILALFYSLLTRDVALYCILQALVSKYKLELSRYSLWIRNQFEFNAVDIFDVASYAGRLARNRESDFSDHILTFFTDMGKKCNIQLPVKSRMVINIDTICKSNGDCRKTKESETSQGYVNENKLPKNSLHIAASIGDAAAVGLLVEVYRSVEPMDSKGWTPLHYAVNGLHFETVRVLLELGAHGDTEDFEGLTPIELAKRKNSQAMLKLFKDYNDSISKGSHPSHHLMNPQEDINRRDREGRTVLHIAAGFGNAEEVAYSLELGADLNVKDKKGRTPFNHAVFSKNEQTISLLSK